LKNKPSHKKDTMLFHLTSPNMVSLLEVPTLQPVACLQVLLTPPLDGEKRFHRRGMGEQWLYPDATKMKNNVDQQCLNV
jgi:hypothetical protein